MLFVYLCIFIHKSSSSEIVFMWVGACAEAIPQNVIHFFFFFWDSSFIGWDSTSVEM